MIDFTEGNGRPTPWWDSSNLDWLEGIEIIATDMANAHPAGLLPPALDCAVRVADPLDVVRVE